MTRFSVGALLVVSVLSACTSLIAKAPPPSQFAASLSNTWLNVKIPVRGAEATLVLTAVNNGVETWQTGDAVSISLRSGVVVGTRGLGFDVMGADVEPTLRALAGARSGTYLLKRGFLTADNRSEVVTATCSMARSGADGRFVEDCTAPGMTFRNEYWLTASGKVAKSNQWLGPEVQVLNMAYVSAK